MLILFSRLTAIFILIISLPAIAKPICDPLSLIKNNQQVLACYLLEPENITQPLVLQSIQKDPKLNVSIKTYTLISQTWPKPTMSAKGVLWKHTLIVYQPDHITTDQALLFVNGGTHYVNPNAPNSFPIQLDFSHMAAATHSVVIDLQDVPNQYLMLDDGILRKEDNLVAYTWSRYLDDPDHNRYWPLHLPMTKAVIKAMDAVQRIIAQDSSTHINHFVISGASKRGWTSWLAALSDQRINAIVPIVIDILNMKANLDHIYASYNNRWPLAFYDYINQKIPERVNTPAFARLITIEDPLAYLTCRQCKFYKKRLSIPKYIISASGDDFFVPDSLSLYLNKLPGETEVRMVPNQSHFINMTIVEEALLSYYRTIIDHSKRPSLQWKLNADGRLDSVTTNSEPISVKLWEAENPVSRDFRLAAHITYSAKNLVGQCHQHHCQYPIAIISPLIGWKSSFVEVTFHQPNGEILVLTTPAYVS